MDAVIPYLESEPMLIEDVPFDITIVGDLHGQVRKFLWQMFSHNVAKSSANIDMRLVQLKIHFVHCPNTLERIVNDKFVLCLRGYQPSYFALYY